MHNWNIIFWGSFQFWYHFASATNLQEKHPFDFHFDKFSTSTWKNHEIYVDLGRLRSICQFLLNSNLVPSLMCIHDPIADNWSTVYSSKTVCTSNKCSMAKTDSNDKWCFASTFLTMYLIDSMLAYHVPDP